MLLYADYHLTSTDSERKSDVLVSMEFYTATRFYCAHESVFSFSCVRSTH